MIANIVMMAAITGLLASLFLGTNSNEQIGKTAVICVIVLFVRAICSIYSSRMGYLSSKTVKKVIREQIYKKLLRLGTGYKEKVQTSEIVQVAVEGVEQLETYFSAYIPKFSMQCFFANSFIVLCFVNVPCSGSSYLCSVNSDRDCSCADMGEKKLLSKYWGSIQHLVTHFLENLQGLTTLKSTSHTYKNEEMNQKQKSLKDHNEGADDTAKFNYDYGFYRIWRCRTWNDSCCDAVSVWSCPIYRVVF